MPPHELLSFEEHLIDSFYQKRKCVLDILYEVIYIYNLMYGNQLIYKIRDIKCTACGFTTPHRYKMKLES